MKRRLNDIVVNSLPLASTGQYDVWDTSLPGFGLRIGTRRKTFIINTRSLYLLDERHCGSFRPHCIR